MANIAFLDCSNLKVYPGYEGAAAAGGDPRQQQWVPYQVQCPCPIQKEEKNLFNFWFSAPGRTPPTAGPRQSY